MAGLDPWNFGFPLPLRIRNGQWKKLCGNFLSVPLTHRISAHALRCHALLWPGQVIWHVSSVRKARAKVGVVSMKWPALTFTNSVTWAPFTNPRAREAQLERFAEILLELPHWNKMNRHFFYTLFSPRSLIVWGLNRLTDSLSRNTSRMRAGRNVLFHFLWEVNIGFPSVQVVYNGRFHHSPGGACVNFDFTWETRARVCLTSE